MHEKKTVLSEKHDKLIFLQGNAPIQMTTMVRDHLESLNWEILLHSTSGLVNSLLRKRGLLQKRKSFFWRGIQKLSERWEKRKFVISCYEKSMYFSEDSGLSLYTSYYLKDFQKT